MDDGTCSPGYSETVNRTVAIRWKATDRIHDTYPVSTWNKEVTNYHFNLQLANVVFTL